VARPGDRLTAAQYRREIALVLQEAAQRGIVPRELRCGSKRFKLARIDSLAGAMMLVNSLVMSDLDRERWCAVEPLSPEINAVVSWARRLQRMESEWAEGEAELARLRARALASLTDSGTGAELQAAPGASAREAR
jgi:hypothetical protein